MSPDFRESDFEQPDKAPKGRKIPYMPKRDATLSVQREWLSLGIGSPPHMRLDSAIRSGKDDDSAVMFYFSNGMEVRCPQQKRLQSPGTFAGFWASETDGVCRPPYMTRQEVSEWFSVMCSVATAQAGLSELDILRERLESFVAMCEPVRGSLALPVTNRFVTLTALKKRAPYDARTRALPVLVLDEELGYFIRAIELITYLRLVHGVTPLSDDFLKGRMSELGCEYHKMQGQAPDRSARGGHPTLVFYRLAEDLSP